MAVYYWRVVYFLYFFLHRNVFASSFPLVGKKKQVTGSFLSSLEIAVISLEWKASGPRHKTLYGSGFDPSIRRHSAIWGAADEAVLNIVRKTKQKIPPKNIYKKILSYLASTISSSSIAPLKAAGSLLGYRVVRGVLIMKNKWLFT